MYTIRINKYWLFLCLMTLLGSAPIAMSLAQGETEMSSKVDKILTATQSGLSPEHGDVMLQVLADRDVPDTKKEEIVKKLWTAVKSVASSNSVPASLHMISVPSEVRSNATAKLQEVQKLEHERASLTNDSRHSK